MITSFTVRLLKYAAFASMGILFNTNLFSILQEMKVEISQRQNSTRFSKLPAEAVSIRFKADSPYTREGEENKIIGHFSAPGFSEAAVGLLLEVFSPEAIVSVLRRIRGDGSVVNMLATIGALVSFFQPSPVLTESI